MALQQIRQTFSESWYRVADLRARLRGTAQISRQHYRGDRWYVVRDPAGNQFHRLSASAYKFVGLLDGTRTVAEAWDLVGGQLADDAPTQNEVIQILTQLHAANLIETNITPDAAVLLRRHKKMVKKQWQGRAMNILFPRIPLWDPDSFLKRWMPVVRYSMTFFAAMVWLAVVISAVVMLVPHANDLKAQASKAVDPGNWLFLGATFIAIKLIHELGHAFSCRKFGGEVHELGVMFLVFVPTPYVDASTAWAFPNKWARVFVGAGGMVIELFVAAIMAFVWLNTKGNETIQQLSYNTMFIASVSTIVFNANPLLRYDGYYILSDLLEIPNLSMKAKEYGLGLIKRHLFGIKQTQPLPPVGQRIWLLLYWITSSIYRVFVGLVIILVVADKVPVLGILMALGGVVTWAALPVGKVLHYHLLDPELHRKRIRAGLISGTFFAAVIALVGFYRFTVHFDALAILEPVQKSIIRVKTAGFVKEIRVKDMQDVKKGDVLLVLEDPQIDKEIAEDAAKLRGLEADLARNQLEDRSRYNALAVQRAALQGSLDDANRRLRELTLVADIDGAVIAPELANLQGKYMSAGDDVATIAQNGTLRALAVIDRSDDSFIYDNDRATGAPLRVELRLASDPTKVIVVRRETVGGAGGPVFRPVPIEQLPSNALNVKNGGMFMVSDEDKDGLRLQSPATQVRLVFDNPSTVDPATGRTAYTYTPGQRAYVRIDYHKESLFWRAKNRLFQLLQQNSHGKWTG